MFDATRSAVRSSARMIGSGRASASRLSRAIRAGSGDVPLEISTVAIETCTASTLPANPLRTDDAPPPPTETPRGVRGGEGGAAAREHDREEVGQGERGDDGQDDRRAVAHPLSQVAKPDRQHGGDRGGPPS